MELERQGRVEHRVATGKGTHRASSGSGWSAAGRASRGEQERALPPCSSAETVPLAWSSVYVVPSSRPSPVDLKTSGAVQLVSMDPSPAWLLDSYSTLSPPIGRFGRPRRRGRSISSQAPASSPPSGGIAPNCHQRLRLAPAVSGRLVDLLATWPGPLCPKGLHPLSEGRYRRVGMCRFPGYARQPPPHACGVRSLGLPGCRRIAACLSSSSGRHWSHRRRSRAHRADRPARSLDGKHHEKGAVGPARPTP